MLGTLLLLFIALPLIDLFVLVKLAGMIGLLETLGIVIITGMLGIGLIRKEGLQILLRLQSAVFADEMQQTMLEGALLVVGGIMLLSPGIITDALGLSLVFSWTRTRLATKLRVRMEESDQVTVQFGHV